MEPAGEKPRPAGKPATGAEAQPATGAQPASGSQPTTGADADPATGAQPTTATGAQPTTATGAQPTTATGAQPAVGQSNEERIEGLRSWVATLDRRLGVRSYVGAALVVLALAAGIAGVVLALSAKEESATTSEVQALRDQVEIVQEQASEAAREDVATLTDRLDALEGRVNTIASGQRTTESELSVVQDDIDELRSEISGPDGAGTGGAGP